MPWQLATRRLQLNSVSAARMVSGIVVAVAGAIALQMLFTGVQSSYTISGLTPAPNRVQIDLEGTSQTGETAAVDQFRHTPGVVNATGLIQGAALALATPSGGAISPDTDAAVPVTVGDCASLAQIAAVGSCKDGDVFLVPDFTVGDNSNLATVADPGARLNLDDDLGVTTNGPVEPWTISASARTVSPVPSTGDMTVGVLATPGALNLSELQDTQVTVLIGLDPNRPDALEQVRNTAFRISPGLGISTPSVPAMDRKYSQIQRGVLAGSVIMLLLIGASLLVSVLEQLRERRKLLAVLVAFGTRRSTLALSVLFQTAIPIALGLLLALVGGVGLGVLLLRMAVRPIAVNWTDIAVITGIGAGMVVAVTLLSLPPLWRMMRPDGLRTE